MAKKQPKTPRASRRRRLDAYIRHIYKQRPVLKQTAPALVADLADAEYQRDCVFLDLQDEGLDERTKQRLRELWLRLLDRVLSIRTRLGLDVPPDNDTGPDDDMTPEERAEFNRLEERSRANYRKLFGQEK